MSINISADPSSDWGVSEHGEALPPEPECCPAPSHRQRSGNHPWKVPGKGPQETRGGAWRPTCLSFPSYSFPHFTTVESVGCITIKEEGSSVQKRPLQFRNILAEHADKIHRQHTDPFMEGILLDCVHTHSFPCAPHVTIHSSFKEHTH